MSDPNSGHTYLELARALLERYDTLLTTTRSGNWEKIDEDLMEMVESFHNLEQGVNLLVPSERSEARSIFTVVLEKDRLLQDIILGRIDDIAVLLANRP